MVLVNSGFHPRNKFNNHKKFWHTYSKMFASPAVGRKCLEKKNRFWRGATSLACPRRPHVSGRPCYLHSAVYGVFLYTVNWCKTSCLMCIPVLLFSRFRFCPFSYRRSKKKSHFVTNLKLYSFFWGIPRRLNLMCRRFGTLCSIFMGGVSTPKHPIERIQHSEHGGSLRSRNLMLWIFRAAVHYTLSHFQPFCTMFITHLLLLHVSANVYGRL